MEPYLAVFKQISWLILSSVKTTLGWYLTRLRVLVWLYRKEIATAFVYVYLMKGIFTLQGLFNPSAGCYLQNGLNISHNGLFFPQMGPIKLNLYSLRGRSQNCSMEILSAPSLTLKHLSKPFIRPDWLILRKQWHRKQRHKKIRLKKFITK